MFGSLFNKMKLTKQETEKIVKDYNLGRLKSIKPLSGGSVNYNFTLTTFKGIFVLRIIIKKLNLKKLNLEFKALEYLNEEGFPYQIPNPVKNNKGKYLSKLNDKNIWIYEKIRGKCVKSLNEVQLKNTIKALAIYHKHIGKFKIKAKEENEIKGLKGRLLKLSKVKPKNKLDRLMLKNLSMIEQVYEKIKDKKFNENRLLIHKDIHKKNLLFEGNQVISILDFENIRLSPRIMDIAYLIKTTVAYGENRFMKRVNLIINEYDKTNHLTKQEKSDILLILAKDSCVMFDYFYRTSGQDIKDDGEYLCLKWTVDVVKQVVRELGWKINLKF
jgi:Ser/Thr protein kinase RdoA (MazF antagonist)